MSGAGLTSATRTKRASDASAECSRIPGSGHLGGQMSLRRAGVLMTIVASSVGQVGAPPARSRAPRPPVVISEEKGLVFRLSEGAAVAERRTPPAPAEPLDPEATQR